MSLCKECPARCCHNVNIPLTPEEAIFLKSKGTKLQAIEPIQIYHAPNIGPLQRLVNIARGKQPSPQVRRYYYMARCGCLTPAQSDTNPLGQRCSIYFDGRRPAICGEFPAGSPVCRAMRKQAGIYTYHLPY